MLKKRSTIEEVPGVSKEADFYESRQATKADIAHRHAKYGYDPIDKAIREKKLQIGETEEYQNYCSQVLEDHVKTMMQFELAYDFTFEGEKLGFSIAIARYGEEGRKFLEVDETMPHCAAYPHIIKPTDELIAIGEDLVLEPSEDNFLSLKQTLVEAPRPLKLTFIYGERRDEAFFEQEERRRNTKKPAEEVPPPPTPPEDIKEEEEPEEPPAVVEPEDPVPPPVDDQIQEVPPPDVEEEVPEDDLPCCIMCYGAKCYCDF